MTDKDNLYSSSRAYVHDSFELSIFYFVYLNISCLGCFVCVCVHHVPGALGSPGTELTDDCELLCGLWELNLGFLKENPVIFTI